ncbi:galactosyl transferase family protein, partial [Tanacetum coccineum]
MLAREQQKKLTALEMELAAARQQGFVSKHLSTTKTPPKKRPLVVIGVLTSFGRKNNREVIRKAWMSTGKHITTISIILCYFVLVGDALRKMEDQKGVIARFVVGRSANRGDSLDRGIDIEDKNYNDFFIL